MTEQYEYGASLTASESVMSRIQSTDHEEAIFDHQRGNIKMVNWPDCGGQRVSRL